MPKIRCECGKIINLRQTPNPNQMLIIPDVDFDKYWDGEPDIEKLYDEMKIVAVCNDCGRLYIFWNGFDKRPVVYKKE